MEVTITWQWAIFIIGIIICLIGLFYPKKGNEYMVIMKDLMWFSALAIFATTWGGIFIW
jgi:hypothetical protein